MPIIRAKGVDSVTVSEDGKHTVFEFESADEKRNFGVVLPSAALSGLMTLAWQASDRSRVILQSDSDALKKGALQVESLDFHAHPDSDGVQVYFRLADGVSLAIDVHQDMAVHLRDVLNVLLGYLSNASSSSKPH